MDTVKKEVIKGMLQQKKFMLEGNLKQIRMQERDITERTTGVDLTDKYYGWGWIAVAAQKIADLAKECEHLEKEIGEMQGMYKFLTGEELER